MSFRDALRGTWEDIKLPFRVAPWVLLVVLALPSLAGLTDRRLIVRDLGYEAGMIRQFVEPSIDLGMPMVGNWTAEIEGLVGGMLMVVCAGSGSAPYDSKIEPVFMTPDTWTGDDCSGLMAGEGYNARASYSWFLEDGSIETITRQFSFIHEPSP